MSGLFRSEDMMYVRVIMADDTAYDTVRELGRFKKLHIVDLSEKEQAAHAAGGNVGGGAPGGLGSGPSVDSAYTYYKKRVATCQFWERKFQSFKDAFTQYRIPLPDILSPEEVQLEELRSADVIEDCRAFIDPIESNLTKNVIFRKQHKTQINEYIEYLFVLQFNQNNQFGSGVSGQGQFEAYGGVHATGGVPGGVGSLNDEEKMEGGGYGGSRGGAKFTSTLCGVIPQDKIIAFERLLFRVSRGNAFSAFYTIPQLIEDPATGEMVQKQVFTITFMGEQLARRISRIIQHSGATEYPIPGTPSEIMGLQRDIQMKLDDSNTLLQRTDSEIRELLSTLAVDPTTRGRSPVSSPYYNWLTALQKERAICNIMKKCEQDNVNSKMITLEGWCPNEYIDELRYSLAQAVRQTQAKQAVLQTFDHPPNHAIPPTYFKTNAFTSSFQGIVDTYGVPRYKEVNPGLFTIISFPFLFGIMYGDIGHGTILFLFACWMLFNEKKFLDQLKRGQMGEIPSMVFGGRYLLVMMGAFALYAGTIYNDCFSNPVHAFASRWGSFNETNVAINAAGGTGPWQWVSEPNVTTGISTIEDFDGPYPYGVDPGWYHTSNELAFFNSMKMKLAVTLGVTQMTFGICLGALNDIYFKDYLAIFFEFIPRLIFILATFGYMVFIIIFKMCCDWAGKSPPLLIQTMIKMFLSPGSVEKADELYEGQGLIQALLVLMAVFSVPFMLFPIPCITNCRNKVYLQKLKGLQSSPSMSGPIDPRMEIQMHDVAFGSPSSGNKSLEEKLINSSHHSTAEPLRHSVSSRAVIIDDREEKTSETQPVVVSLISDEDLDAGHGEHALGEHYSYSDHLIVQGIHTIEFVLGTVSNTASYLRLWALSLAHAELSSVFWDKMIMQYGINGSNPGSAVLGFAVWAVATFAVLLAMDVLECFLHALRLHWVEFQNKFFRADGYAFEPFSFENLEEMNS